MKKLAEENQIHRGIQHKLLEMFKGVEGKTFDNDITINTYKDFLDIVFNVVSHENIVLDEDGCFK